MPDDPPIAPNGAALDDHPLALLGLVAEAGRARHPLGRFAAGLARRPRAAVGPFTLRSA